MMHGEDGWEVCRKIKGVVETSGIPVVMLTVRMNEEDVKKSLGYAGADMPLLTI